MPAATTRIFGLQQPAEEIIAGLNRFQPRIICGFSSAVALLLRFQAERRLAIAPERIFCNTDHLTAETRTACRRLWNQDPQVMVTATKVGILATECGRGFLHLNESDILWHEDSQPQECRLPSLVNHMQPVVHYRLPLTLHRLEGLCPCGDSGACIAPIAGRTIRPLLLPDSRARLQYLHPIALRSALDRVEGLCWHQANVVGRRLFIAVAGTADLDCVRQSTVMALNKAGICQPEISVHRLTRERDVAP